MSRLTTDLLKFRKWRIMVRRRLYYDYDVSRFFLLMLTIHVKLAIATFILLPFITIALGYFNKNDKSEYGYLR